MKQIQYIIILLLFSATAFAEDYNNPIYGSSSSRGVTYFDVPGKATTGSSKVNSFKRFSAGSDRLRPRDAVRSPNPFSYSNKASNRMPTSGLGSVRKMAGQVNVRIRTPRFDSRIGSYNMASLSGGSGANSFNKLSSGSSSRYVANSNISSKYPLRIRRITNPKLKQFTSANSSLLANRNKRLLQGNRRGRLSYSKVGMNKSIVNRSSRIRGVSRLTSGKYSTSSILNNR